MPLPKLPKLPLVILLHPLKLLKIITKHQHRVQWLLNTVHLIQLIIQPKTPNLDHLYQVKLQQHSFVLLHPHRVKHLVKLHNTIHLYQVKPQPHRMVLLHLLTILLVKHLQIVPQLQLLHTNLLQLALLQQPHLQMDRGLVSFNHKAKISRTISTDSQLKASISRTNLTHKHHL